MTTREQYEIERAIIRADEAAYRERADRPLYMYEADRRVFTVYGGEMTLEFLEDVLTDPPQGHFVLGLPDGQVSTRGIRYLLECVAPVRGIPCS